MEILTQLKSLRNLINSFDKVLQGLDEAQEHFIEVFLDKDISSNYLATNPSQEEVLETMVMLEDYVLVSSYLIDHPLIKTMESMRDGKVMSRLDKPLNVVAKTIVRDSKWVSKYKDEVTVIELIKDGKFSWQRYVIYKDKFGEVLCLPIHVFVNWYEKRLSDEL